MNEENEKIRVELLKYVSASDRLEKAQLGHKAAREALDAHESVCEMERPKAASIGCFPLHIRRNRTVAPVSWPCTAESNSCEIPKYCNRYRDDLIACFELQAEEEMACNNLSWVVSELKKSIVVVNGDILVLDNIFDDDNKKKYAGKMFDFSPPTEKDLRTFTKTHGIEGKPFLTFDDVVEKLIIKG